MPPEDNKKQPSFRKVDRETEERERVDDRIPFFIDYEDKDVIFIPSQVSQRLDFNLNSPIGSGGALIQRKITFADDATPSVKNANLCVTGGTTTITDFDDGRVGQVIMIKAEHSVTITDNSNIVLSGGSNYNMTATDTLTLAMFEDGVWYEISRSVN